MALHGKIRWILVVWVALILPLPAGSDDWDWTVHQGGVPARLNALAWSGSLLVAVGDSGTILTSPDGLTWTPRLVGTTRNLLDAAWSGSAFVAVGSFGTIVRSTDGLTWNEIESGTSCNLLKIASNRANFFVSADSGTAGTSVSGLAWNFGSSPASGLADLIWTGSTYAGVRASSALLSPDGMSWTSHQIAEPGWTDWFQSIGVANGTLYAASRSRVYSSTDGQSWPAWHGFSSEPAPFAGNGSEFLAINATTLRQQSDQSWLTVHKNRFESVRDALWIPDRYVALDEDGRIAVSPDAAVWTYPVHFIAPNRPARAHWTGSRLVTFETMGFSSNLKTVLSSPDGRSWSHHSPDNHMELHDIVSEDGNNFILGSQQLVLASTDGGTWDIRHVNIDGPAFVAGDCRNSTLYALSDSGTLHSSPDGSNWTQLPAPNLTETRHLVWNGTILLALGDSSHTSPDGTAWTAGDSGLGSITEALWTGTTFVAVGQGGLIRTSADGLSWTQVPPLTADDLTDVTWSGSALVAVGAESTILHSFDGDHWTAVPLSGDPLDLTGVAWTGREFLAISSELTLSSPDGLNWTSITPDRWSDAVWTGERFVATGSSGRIVTSEDGTDWTPRYSNTLSDLGAVSSINNRVFASGSDGTVLQSPDGVTWSPSATGLARRDEIAWNGAFYLAAGVKQVYRSTDGLNWTSHPVPYTFDWIIADGAVFRAETHQDHDVGSTLTSTDGLTWTRVASRSMLSGAAVGNGLIVATTDGGEVVTSADGSEWTVRDTPATSALNAIAWIGDKFVAVGGERAVLISPDGIDWASHPINRFSPTAILEGLAWNGERLVAVSQFDFYHSPDGVTWNLTRSVPISNAEAVTWSGSLFVAVGSGGTIANSPDGITWMRATSPTTDDLRNVAWTGSQFVAVGTPGVILTSPDGVSWTGRVSGAFSVLRGVAALGSRLIVVGNQHELLISDDGISWSSIHPGVEATTGYDHVFTTGGRAYAIGYGGVVISSADGITWSLHRNGTDRPSLPPVRNAVGLWLADKFRAYFQAEPDLVWPQPLFSPDIYLNPNHFVWTGSSFVATGIRGLIATSRNGRDWRISTADGYRNSGAIAFSPTRVVAVGSSNTIISAPNPAPQTPLEIWRCDTNLGPGQDALLDVAHPLGFNNLMAYGLDLPFSDLDGPLALLAPHPPDRTDAGFTFGLPAIDRPGLRYIVETASSVIPDRWTEIARKEPGSSWTGNAVIITTLRDHRWVTLQVLDSTLPAPETLLYRLRLEYLE